MDQVVDKGHTIRAGEREFLVQVLRGHEPAIELAMMLFRISQTWDDVVDEESVSHRRINEMLWDALFSLTESPFYVQYIGEIKPVLKMAALDWIAANELERGSEHDRTLSYVLRDSLTMLVQQLALIVGGYEWAVEVTPAIRRHFHDERLADYLGDLP